MAIWREYSISYVRRNKAASISILAAALIAATLLSLTCGIFYNVWASEIEQVEIKEGEWHAQLTGDISDEDAAVLASNPDIKDVILSDDPQGGGKTVYLTYNRPGNVYDTLPRIAEGIGLSEDAITYHSALLAKHFIFPRGEAVVPPIVIAYAAVLLTACLSLIMVIHNAFGVSMNARLHQLGILQSIGASPRQIRAALVHEALLLCVLPILVGVGAGSALCRAFMALIEHATREARAYELTFQYHALIPLAATLLSLLTVWLSSRIPARRISRLSPLESIRNGSETAVAKVRGFFLLSRFFGVEGELARKSLYVRRKAFRTATVSLLLSFLAFSIFLNIEAISSISTKYTYFERYKDRWDLMLTVPDSESEDGLLTDIRDIPGVKSCISYRKAQAYTDISADMLSDEVLGLGGLMSLSDTGIKKTEGKYRIEAPLLILDDTSFEAYRHSVAAPEASGQGDVILVNTIWDNLNSNRREKTMIPFLREDVASLEMRGENGGLPVSRIMDKTGVLPALREEFPDFSLVLVMPESAYRAIADSLPAAEWYFNIRAESDAEIPEIERTLKGLAGEIDGYVLENRLERVRSNETIRNAYRICIIGLAGLLACIGLANVFSNTLGYLHQRKREFARYLTCGLSPGGVRKVLCAEAVVLALRPILISLLINIPAVLLALNAALIGPGEYLQHIPAVPIAAFACVIIAAVGLSYFLGGRQLIRADMVQVLKDDTMV